LGVTQLQLFYKISERNFLNVNARGDQCDNCGKTFDATELKNPVSKMTGSRDLEVRETEHYYIALGKLNDQLLEWASKDKAHWRKHVLNFTLGELSKKELRGRAITRDLEWGVTIPQPNSDGKRIYVWFEAVMGYLSAVKEWAMISGQSEKWTHYWQNPEARSYYFIGKDNITFHSVLWPAILMAKGDLNLPYDVPANEYLNTFGRKISKSRGTAIAVLDVLERYQPDAWRYALAALAPETADVDFTWDDFLEKVNNELVANWGNLVNRTLGFAFKRYEEKIPQPEAFEQVDLQVLEEVKAGFEQIGALYRAVRLRTALEETRKLSQRVNQYLNDMAPWTLIKTDPTRAQTTVYTALQCITWLNTMFAPVLPYSAQVIFETLGFDGQLFGRQFSEEVKDAKGSHEVLRYDHSEAVGIWEPLILKPGQVMRTPSAPFIKLDPAVLDQEFKPE